MGIISVLTSSEASSNTSPVEGTVPTSILTLTRDNHVLHAHLSSSNQQDFLKPTDHAPPEHPSLHLNTLTTTMTAIIAASTTTASAASSSDDIDMIFDRHESQNDAHEAANGDAVEAIDVDEDADWGDSRILLGDEDCAAEELEEDEQEGAFPNEPGKIFIGGLNPCTTIEKLKIYFRKYGEIKNSLIMRDIVTKKSRGFGFVTFVDPNVVESVLNDAPHTLDSKRIEPKIAVPKQTAMKAIASIETCELMMDKTTNRHRGFGFITFAEEGAAEAVCQAHYHELQGKMIEAKKALPKEVLSTSNVLMKQRQQLLQPLYMPTRLNGSAMDTNATRAAATAFTSGINAAAANLLRPGGIQMAHALAGATGVPQLSTSVTSQSMALAMATAAAIAARQQHQQQQMAQGAEQSNQQRMAQAAIMASTPVSSLQASLGIPEILSLMPLTYSTGVPELTAFNSLQPALMGPLAYTNRLPNGSAGAANCIVGPSAFPSVAAMAAPKLISQTTPPPTAMALDSNGAMNMAVAFQGVYAASSQQPYPQAQHPQTFYQHTGFYGATGFQQLQQQQAMASLAASVAAGLQIPQIPTSQIHPGQNSANGVQSDIDTSLIQQGIVIQQAPVLNSNAHASNLANGDPGLSAAAANNGATTQEAQPSASVARTSAINTNYASNSSAQSAAVLSDSNPGYWLIPAKIPRDHYSPYDVQMWTQ